MSVGKRQARRKDMRLQGGNPGWFAPVARPQDPEQVDAITLAHPTNLWVEIQKELSGLPERFRSLDRSLFAVGGIVRDGLLGVTQPSHTDIDLTTDAKPKETHVALEGWADDIWDLGEKFGTVAARRNGRDIEITTFRSDAYQSDSRKPVVRFSEHIEEDLKRRDFTINAMAVNLADNSLVDPYGGERDLKNRCLRTPQEPGVTFSEDPLRMLRAARFVAKLGMLPESVMVAAIREQRDRLQIVSGERIHQEVLKLLALPDPRPGLALLHETGLASLVFGRGLDQGAVGISNDLQDEPLGRLALLHIKDDTGRALALLMRRWHSARSDELAVVGARDAAWEAINDPPADTPRLRRWLIRRGPHVDLGLRIAQTQQDVEGLRHRVEELRIAEPDLGEPVMGGQAIMTALGVSPGPLIGEAQRYLMEVRVSDGPMPPRVAQQMLLRWHSAQQKQPSRVLP